MNTFHARRSGIYMCNTHDTTENITDTRATAPHNWNWRRVKKKQKRKI